MKVFNAAVVLPLLASGQSISEINGNKYVSPYNGQTVSNVKGLVTAKGPNGFWMRSTNPDNDNTTSESIYVYGKSTLSAVDVGDIISLDGKVSDYRSSSTYLFSPEIGSASNINVQSSNNTVTPVALGENGLNPPTDQYTSLDNGNIFAVPNNQSLISVVNPTLDPSSYGMDFWQSLSGELVTISNPRAVSRPNQYGDTWVIGTWPVTGLNNRGGLTLTNQDANPESIVIIDPLDGTDNPQSIKLADELADITGVINYAFGFYSISPMTALKVTKAKTPLNPPRTSITSSGKCSGITFGQWNVENLAPNSTTLPQIASQIVKFLRTPDIIFLEEIQDNDGPTDDGVVSANKTLSTLADAITSAGGKFQYSYVDIDPVNDISGGEPGGNIRNAYMWNPNVLQLHRPNPGNATQGTKVKKGKGGLYLGHNPGYIDPSNSAWTDSRVPLVAQWETVNGGDQFFTINVHWTSKGGSTSLEGDDRTPVNLGVQQRNQQGKLTGAFVKQILKHDKNAAVITGGDMNEFVFVQPVNTFESTSGSSNLDVVVGNDPTERYTYQFGQNCEQLQHMYVSPKLANAAGQKFEHVHLSTWKTFAEDTSDHDPSVAKLNVCT